MKEYAKMEKIKLGKTNLYVNRIGFGGIPIQRVCQSDVNEIILALLKEGINFIDTNPGNNLTYKGSINGWGINFDGQGSQGGNVFNCTFKDFNQAVIAKGCNYVTVQDCNFTGGMATEIINDPTVNKEKGSKLISAGGSFYLTVKNCIFDGPVLDAISIYSGSGNANITGNTFINNAYSIYFGGASTAESYIRNNKFINCGQFVLENGTVWGALPVISIQKSSDQILVVGAGVIALFTLQWCKILGGKNITTLIRNKSRKDIAIKYGSNNVVSSLDEDYETALMKLSNGKGYDYIYRYFLHL